MRQRSTFSFIFLLVAGLFFLILNSFPAVRVFKNIVLKLLFSASEAVYYPVEETGAVYRHAKTLISLQRENQKLKKDISYLKSRYLDTEYLRNMAARQLDSDLPKRIVPAQVILHSLDQYLTEFNINLGKKNNVKRDMPVVSISGSKWVLAGRVDEVFDDFSRVVLITSSDFRCGAEITRTGYTGVIKGNNEWTLELKYLSPDAQVWGDDEVYTSGTGGIFPPGLFIGKVLEVKALEFSKGKEATVEPFSFPQNSRYVHVVIQ
jgi:rod shape-determining protein MreC